MEITINSKIEISDAELLAYFREGLYNVGDASGFYETIADNLNINVEDISKESRKNLKDRLEIILKEQLNKLNYDEEISN